ncbi:MAG: ABC transporter substrate-binding protein [Desulfobacterales bacterium]
MKERHLAWGLVAAALFLALTGMAGTLQAEEVIKVGVIANLDYPAGVGTKNASEMAAEEINASGGIMGKKLELVIADPKLNPTMGAYEYIRLATEEKVAAVFGTWSSEMAMEILKEVPKYKVPYLVGVSTPEVTEKVKQNYDSLKYVFKMYFHSDEMADFSSEWLISEMVKKRGFKRFGFLVEDAKWAHPLAAKWEKDLKAAGAEIPVREYFYIKSKEFTPIFSQMKESGCQAACVFSAHVDASAYIGQWADVKGPMMIGLVASFPTALKASDNRAVSLVSLSWPGTFPVREKDKIFHDKYWEKYKIGPEYNATHVYDALYMFKAAAERAKSLDADALAEALEQTDYDGVMGRWVFDKASHHPKFGPGFRQFMMMQWQENEKACIVWPEDVKTCDLILPPWHEKN